MHNQLKTAELADIFDYIYTNLYLCIILIQIAYNYTDYFCIIFMYYNYPGIRNIL